MSKEIDYKSIPLRQEPTIPDTRNWRLDRLIPQSSVSKVFPKSFRKTRNHPLTNQFWVGKCVAQSAVNAMEPVEELQYGKYIPLSSSSLYANRKETDWQGSGMCPEQAYLAYRDFGIAELKDFDVLKEYPDIKVDFLANKEMILKSAFPHRISGFAQVYSSDELKTALMNPRVGVVVEIPIYASFYSISKENPLMPMPNTTTEKLYGFHMLEIEGWNEDGTWIYGNSWGDGFGIDGFFYVQPEFIPIVRYALTDDILPDPQPEPLPTPDGTYTIKMNSTIKTVAVNFPIHLSIQLLDSNNTPVPNQTIQMICFGCENGGASASTDSEGIAYFEPISKVSGNAKCSFIYFSSKGVKYQVDENVSWTDPKPTHDYNIIVTYDKKTAYVGEIINFTAQLLDNNIPQPNKTATVDIFNTNNKSTQSQKTSDANGCIKLQLTSSTAGSMDIIVNWEDFGIGTGCLWLAVEPKPEPEIHDYKLILDCPVKVVKIKESIKLFVKTLDGNKVVPNQVVKFVVTGAMTDDGELSTDANGGLELNPFYSKEGIANYSFEWVNSDGVLKESVVLVWGKEDEIEPEPPKPEKKLYHVQTLPIKSTKTEEIEAQKVLLHELGFEVYSTISNQIVANSTEALAKVNSDKLSAKGIKNIILYY